MTSSDKDQFIPDLIDGPMIGKAAKKHFSPDGSYPLEVSIFDPNTRRGYTYKFVPEAQTGEPGSYEYAGSYYSA